MKQNERDKQKSGHKTMKQKINIQWRELTEAKVGF